MKVYTYNDQTKSLKEWAEHLNLKKTTLWHRITRLHWDIARAIETPLKAPGPKGHVVCSICGKDISQMKSHFNPPKCLVCKNYQKSGNTIHELPPYGEVKFCERGFPICHICGKSFSVLGRHINYAHGLLASEYRRQFGLCQNSQLSSNEYVRKMRANVFETGTVDNVYLYGEETRYQEGHEGGKPKAPQCAKQPRRFT